MTDYEYIEGLELIPKIKERRIVSNERVLTTKDRAEILLYEEEFLLNCVFRQSKKERITMSKFECNFKYENEILTIEVL